MMRRLPKILLALSIAALITGLVVNLSGEWFPPGWTVAFPVGVILLGAFWISWLFQEEVAVFEKEERARSEAADRLRDDDSIKEKRPAKRPEKVGETSAPNSAAHFFR